MIETHKDEVYLAIKAMIAADAFDAAADLAEREEICVCAYCGEIGETEKAYIDRLSSYDIRNVPKRSFQAHYKFAKACAECPKNTMRVYLHGLLTRTVV